MTTEIRDAPLSQLYLDVTAELHIVEDNKRPFTNCCAGQTRLYKMALGHLARTLHLREPTCLWSLLPVMTCRSTDSVTVQQTASIQDGSVLCVTTWRLFLPQDN